jgi:hypothetical protein
MTLWRDLKMLSFDFLNNFAHWGNALDKIHHEMPHKHEDFRKSLNPNSMEATIWLCETLSNMPTKKNVGLNITILNSWLGFPLVPLLCENFDVAKINLIDVDKDALELSKIFNKNYVEGGTDLSHLNWDVPFAFHDINALETDIVISMCAETMYPLKDLTTANPDCVFAIQNSNVIKEMYGINCVDSIEEHKKNTGISNPYYEGSIKQKYWTFDGLNEFDRFMVIGTKS